MYINIVFYSLSYFFSLDYWPPQFWKHFIHRSFIDFPISFPHTIGHRNTKIMPPLEFLTRSYRPFIKISDASPSVLVYSAYGIS